MIKKILGHRLDIGLDLIITEGESTPYTQHSDAKGKEVILNVKC